MKLFVSHKSALEYWRRRRKLPVNSSDRRCRDILPDKPPGFSRLVYSGISLPVDILLKNSSSRRICRFAKQHVFSGETPVGSFMNIGNGFMMSSPEFCFLQMAERLTLIELIELGYELCGVYSLPLGDERDIPRSGFFNRKQLTSTKRLHEFLSLTSGAKGHKKAMRALRYLCDGSASPMETKLTMLLCLPHMLGGYALDLPDLNKRIMLPKNLRRYFYNEYYVCDLYWPGKKVVVEYDSDIHHTGSERISNDSKKRNTLASMGVMVVSITRLQVKNSKELEMAIKTVTKLMGRRLQIKSSSFYAARLELRKQLL